MWSNVEAFFGASGKSLDRRLSDPLLLAAISARAAPACDRNPSILILAALIPVSTAVMLYTFLGGFFAGHLLMS